jgi:hypothetical protein
VHGSLVNDCPHPRTKMPLVGLPGSGGERVTALSRLEQLRVSTGLAPARPSGRPQDGVTPREGTGQRCGGPSGARLHVEDARLERLHTVILTPWPCGKYQLVGTVTDHWPWGRRGDRRSWERQGSVPCRWHRVLRSCPQTRPQPSKRSDAKSICGDKDGPAWVCHVTLATRRLTGWVHETALAVHLILM